MAKNPTTPATPPQISVDGGTPARLRCRPASRYLPTVASAVTTTVMATTVQPAMPPVTTPHTMIAAATSRPPGRTCTTTPTRPTSTTRPTRRSPTEFTRWTVLPARRRFSSERSVPDDGDRDVDHREPGDGREVAGGHARGLAHAEDHQRGDHEGDDELDG